MSTATKVPAKSEKPVHSTAPARTLAEPKSLRAAEGGGLESIQQSAGNLAVQHLFRAGAIQAKLSISQPNDPDEQEADQVADRIMRMPDTAAVKSSCPTCATGTTPCPTCSEGQSTTIHRKAVGGVGNNPSPSAHRIIGRLGPGHPLDRSTRAFFEPRLGSDLSHVRVHTGGDAAELARLISARAFTLGRDVVFGSAQYVPESTEGQHLLAHELMHTLQQPTASSTLRRQTAASAPATAATTPATATSLDVGSVTTAIAQAVREGNVGAAVNSLRGRSLADRASLRVAVKWQNKGLEHWFAERINRAGLLRTATKALTAIASIATLDAGLLGLAVSQLSGGRAASEDGTPEEGLRLLWSVVPLIDRLEVYDEGYREIEQAQLDVIRAASPDERIGARSETRRLDAIYANLGVKEEYDARLLIDPEKKYAAADSLLKRAPGVLLDDEDLVFDAIWALTPAERRVFYKEKEIALKSLLLEDRFKLLGTLVAGTEVEALIARLRLATEGRIDDQEAVRAVVDRAVALLAEQKNLRATLAVTTLPPDELSKAQTRLNELGELESLLKFGTGKLDPKSFLGRLADVSDSSEAFGAMAQRLGGTITDPAEQTEFAFRTAKQRVLMAAGLTGANEDSIRNAILELRAPPITDAGKLTPRERDQKQTEANAKLRHLLIEDKEVKDVINTMPASAVMRVRSFVNGDSFIEKLTELTVALNAARWGEFFQVVLEIALRADWKARFEDTAKSPFDTFARVHGEQREIMLEILKNKRIPTNKILGFTGNVEVLRTALANVDEGERGQLRVGYLLIKSGRKPADKTEEDALAAYKTFDANLRKSQTTPGSVDTAGIEAVLDAALGAEPTAKEMETDAGRYNAAALMYERQQARLALGRGATYFTETDETMVAAGREFAALWLQLRERTPHRLSTVELGLLSVLHDRFTTRVEEFTEASNTAGEVAGMIAATVAGILIVVGTGGMTAPAVIAAAAAGGTARVVTREMFGEDYYNPAGGEGARDTLLGGIDAALTVLGASLGAKGAELLGLGGKAFLTNAARIGGEVAEEASGRLLHRVTAGAVTTAIDGAFSGFVSEAANAMTDSRTWRRGIWQGLLRVGQAALIGGLSGLAAGAVLGAAIPVVGAGLRRAADRVLGASVERVLAKAGATETLEAARSAMRAGNTAEGERLFAQLEKHLSAEQANVLWRDLSQLAEAATRLEEPISLLGQRHTLKLVEGEQGAYFVLCSWCTRVRDILKEALDKATKEGAVASRIDRLKELIQQVEQMEANFVGKKVSKAEANSVNTMRSLLGKLTEGEHLIGSALRELPARSTPNFAKLARDPAVANRAQELYEGYLEQLWNSRRDIFGKKVDDQLWKQLEKEAQARALSHAQRESARGAPLELGAGVPARSGVDPRVDIPFGFYDRAGFNQFSQRLNATLNHVPDAQLIVEGSAVSGRRFERIVAPHGPTGAPFGMGRLSDYDIAIISDSLFQRAQNPALGIKMSGEAKLATEPLSPKDLRDLGLTNLDAAAREGILDATGIAYPVHFSIRPSSAPKKLGLPLATGST